MGHENSQYYYIETCHFFRDVTTFVDRPVGYNFVYTAYNDRYIVILEKDFRRKFVHVRDVEDCFIHCIKNSNTMFGWPYNFGLDVTNLAKEELTLKITELMLNFYIHFAEVGEDPDKLNYVVSNQRLCEAGF